jgi:hypothetical protein
MINLDPFIDDVLSTDIFGQEALWSPATGASKTIRGIFENAFLGVVGLGEAGVASSTPTFLCKSTDVVDAHRGDTLYLNETTYYIQEVRPDGDGFTLLILSLEA